MAHILITCGYLGVCKVVEVSDPNRSCDGNGLFTGRGRFFCSVVSFSTKYKAGGVVLAWQSRLVWARARNTRGDLELRN
jgi:hypothetical protein